MKLLLALLLFASPASAAFLTGVDSNYVLDMEKSGKTWAGGDPYKLLAAAGADSARIRLWTGDDGMNGLHYATETAKRAQSAGLKPYLVIFLSENWADYVKQPVPKIWKDLSYDDKVKAVEAYAERVTKHFKDAGVAIDLYEIGNEIDFGICGEFEEEWPKRVSLDYMKTRIWSKMAPIIEAAQRGVKKVQPGATFMLHLTQWENVPYSVAFFRFMTENGVQLDFPGFSYFPTNQKAENRPLAALEKNLADYHKALGKPAIICETAFPSMATFPGQFADWNKPIDGYNFDEPGQKKWIADLLAMARKNPHLAGVFYWSPEWYASDADMWKAFALFDGEGKPKPALSAFAKQTAGINVYFGNLHAHTAVSDGTGTPAEAFAYARDVGKLDFLALAEHNHMIGGEKATAEQRGKVYADLVAATDKANEPGKFVAIYGQEFSSMSKGNHVNVFDVSQVIDPAAIPNGDFAGLLKWMDANRDSSGQPAILQFNHPMLGRPGKTIDKNEYGRDDFTDDAGWVAAMGKVTHLIELLNGEEKTADGRAPQVMDRHFALYLKTGFRVAPVGNQDNHKVNWGTATEVRTAVLAPELTRPALLKAMRSRHVYATEDKNLQLIVRVNGQLCGDVLVTPGEAKIDYQIADADEPTATYTFDIFTGTVGGEMPAVTKTVIVDTAAGAIHGVSLDRAGQYLFIRVTQKSPQGEDRAWLAPVWLEKK